MKKRASFYALLFCATVSIISATGIWLSSSENLSIKQNDVLHILYINVIVIFGLIALVFRDLFKLWRKRKSKGSMLQVRLIAIFSTLAVIPSFLMILFSVIFFNKGIESWFNQRNSAVLKEAMNVAESYLEEHRKIIRDDGFGVARALELSFASFTPTQLEDVELVGCSIGDLMDDLFEMKGIYGGIIFEKDKTIARSKYSLSLDFALIGDSDIKNALIDGYKIIESPEKNKIMAIFRIHIPAKDKVFLLIEKKIDQKIANHVSKTKSAHSEYNELGESRNRLEIAFIIIFVAIGILLLLGAIGAAIIFSSQLMRPISNLIDSAEKIMCGDLSTRADISNDDNELRLLSSTFNEMVSQIQLQQTRLREANNQLDEKIQFIINVLSGVSSGVIGLDKDYKINVYNENAENNIGRSVYDGMLIFDIFPEIKELFKRVQNENKVESQINFIKSREHCLFSLKITALKDDNAELSGYIVTFDDITRLISTQRKAAWSDVARRVAHEIKNPLTPIQLAAERIHRKYSQQITSDYDTFKKLVDVIVKQVGDIRRMTDEFSFFARLPEPVLKECNLVDIAKQAVFFMQNAYQDVRLEIKNADINGKFLGDDRLIHQAIVNILQNAVNAMKSVNDNANSTVDISFTENDECIYIKIDDNGPGLPKIDRDMLTEPYFTLMPKGTGLGLAIVKKIMQDHAGDISFADSDLGGASVTMKFPKDYIKKVKHEA